MKAVILEKKGHISLKDIPIAETLTPDDVRIKPYAVGICGSDVHYYREGRIGDFIVSKPMVLGHEASGIITEIGSQVTHLKVGDRVCMEPGIPDFKNPETLKGMYNLDPAVRFWATPPIHGCLRENIVHPANFTFKIPDTMSFHEGALVEPVAIGVYSAKKAAITPGDTALVIGAGTIGIVTALAAEASGCSKVYLADIKKAKLEFVKKHYGNKIEVIDLAAISISDFFKSNKIKGVHFVFEASGSEKAYEKITEYLVPGGKMILVGMPAKPVLIDVVSMQAKELSIETIFRYVNMYPSVIDMISSGKVNVTPLVTKQFSFDQAKEAFEYALTAAEDDVKIMINIA